MDGILIIDKPEGITSHDVVARCRRILRTKRVGHTGTLDPFATGVMIVLVGKATRLARFLDRDAKQYLATVRFGFETDTGDRTGQARSESCGLRDFSQTELEEALAHFRGEILQTPPMYSAKKVDGKKLYELAREGVEIERQPVKITNYELRISHFASEKKVAGAGLLTQDFELEVLCSAGTYIRVLAEDIGKRLGIGAHLAELRRTKAGKFGIDKAVTLEELEKIAGASNLADVLISMNDAVSHLGEIALSAEEIVKVKHGVKLRHDSAQLRDGEVLRLTGAGDLLAIGFYNAAEKVVQPKLVLV